MIKKNILIIATSSVAIIKLPLVIQNLKKHHNVEIIISNAAKKGWEESERYETINEEMDLSKFPEHIKYSKWADLILVVPATANTIAKFYSCIADNFALSTLLGSRKPIIFVPAMNTFMYKKLIDRNIIFNLSKEGHMFIGPVDGKLREGESGMGRMTEPDEITKQVMNYLNPKKQKILLPYGNSIVDIDPVRFISNKSTGTMGKLLANQLRLKGFDVTSIDISDYTNKEFLDLVKTLEFDYYISPAAFADFDVSKSDTKIKKGEISSINLIKNIDIISSVKELKPEAKIIAFKLDEFKSNAIKKMESLNLDGIIWNSISAIGNNKSCGSIILKNKEIPFDNLSKEKLANMIANELI